MAKKKTVSKKTSTPKRSSKSSAKKTSPQFKAAQTRKKNARIKELRRERQSLYSKIYRRKQKIKSFKKEEDLDTGRRIVTQISTLQRGIVKINTKLGVPPKKVLSEKEKEKRVQEAQKSASANFNIDPYIYTKWEAQGQFDDQITGTKWDWYIINGKRMNINNALDIDFEMDEFMSTLKSRDGVLISYNTNTKTIKYEKTTREK